MDKTLWTASLFLVILGFLLLIAGALCRVYVNYKEPRRGRVTARVVDLLLQEPVSQDQIRIYKNCYYPVFEFYAEGKLYKITHPEGSYPSAYRLNQEIRLNYDKDDPTDYVIVKNTALDILPEVFSALGVVCILAGCVLFGLFAARTNK